MIHPYEPFSVKSARPNKSSQQSNNCSARGRTQTANAQLTSLTRSRDVVLKHRELVRAALRDEATVAKLETKLQTLQLEKARQTDPKELISSPTMLDHPIAPRKRRIILFGLLAELLGGIGVSSW